MTDFASMGLGRRDRYLSIGCVFRFPIDVEILSQTVWWMDHLLHDNKYKEVALATTTERQNKTH